MVFGTEIDGGVTAPHGFRAAGAPAGIKPGSTKKDCALMVSDLPAVTVGTFTTNLFKSPPTRWTESVCSNGLARAVFVNSGNANACTGNAGFEDAQATAALVGNGIESPAEGVCILSTGVIGVRLPMDRIALGVQECLKNLSSTGSHDAALAIMTTDTVPKEKAIEVELEAGKIRIGAIAKGSGMISPHMATMFCIITTDAAIEAEPLTDILREAVAGSFNQICVDNDMSTSDAVICMANGTSSVPVVTSRPEDYELFRQAMIELCQEMAKALVRDGEGASKFVEIQVTGAASDKDAKAIARAIAVSQLCKTAFYGQDPNWGRIACAVGYSGAKLDPAKVSIWIDDVQVMEHGMPAAFEEAAAAACMKKPEFRIRIECGKGPGKTTFWTTDLSHEYVKINADYRS
ncbi:MAG: bifunctional glutamate N-acetyltransferase/amino-acid acetyltransferase ArgJ [Candidatus Hydrogenedentes bacterium]|nr:bifunctional glutamate N-acetyltransferase/amino-acid acetyltransferase ArgJ [Candidatus Hydrogenedentota bacterium]